MAFSSSLTTTWIPIPLSFCFRPNIPTCSFPFSHPNRRRRSFSVNADNPPFFEPAGFGPQSDPTPHCPPGLRQYETMAVLRPDMSEDERLSLTHKYEELLVAGGGMYIEVFNRGVIPLAYSIKKKNRAGETNIYFDGIYLLFTYITKPESINILEETLKADDNVIRTMTFKVRKRKY
ncbi:30S ribosomal protein S6 alpha, chloroplastic-like [Abrus precatorius]|uniref:30S ribosomal protein S6 alpha, chloroplastic-like n=1 Tax=Abrus precatorius TaxID=3816 RepID=A0A8B8KRV6_ABRPR|nr:30S ribosomal protein S6 alpha, chloroplastic-like [Abrus precatorius]